MSGLYGFASRLSGCMAGLCAVLALLALPSPSQADTYSDCMTICSVYTNQDFSECMGNCMSGAGPCDVTCSGSYNQCGTGTCNAKKGCDRYKCKLILTAKQCECNTNP